MAFLIKDDSRDKLGHVKVRHFYVHAHDNYTTFDLHFEGSGQWHRIQMEADPFLKLPHQGEIRLKLAEKKSRQKLDDALKQGAEYIEFMNDGEAYIIFEKGAILRLPSGKGLEPWTFSSSDGLIIVSGTDGDLSVFDGPK